jgi:hypothetical protein
MCYKFTHVTCKNAGKDIVFRRSQRCILPVAGAFCFEDLGFQTGSDLSWQQVFGQCSWQKYILVKLRHQVP